MPYEISSFCCVFRASKLVSWPLTWSGVSQLWTLLSMELELVLLKRGPLRIPRFGGRGGIGGRLGACRGLVFAFGLFSEFKDVSELSDWSIASFLFHVCVAGKLGERWLFSSLRLELEPEVGMTG